MDIKKIVLLSSLIVMPVLADFTFFTNNPKATTTIDDAFSVAYCLTSNSMVSQGKNQRIEMLNSIIWALSEERGTADAAESLLQRTNQMMLTEPQELTMQRLDKAGCKNLNLSVISAFDI